MHFKIMLLTTFINASEFIRKKLFCQNFKNSQFTALSCPFEDWLMQCKHFYYCNKYNSVSHDYTYSRSSQECLYQYTVFHSFLQDSSLQAHHLCKNSLAENKLWLLPFSLHMPWQDGCHRYKYIFLVTVQSSATIKICVH